MSTGSKRELPTGIVMDYPRSHADFVQISNLQNSNLESELPAQEIEQQGFVTVQHDLSVLQEMNKRGHHAVARSAGKIVGYALCMPTSFGDKLPVLVPMFELLDKISFEGRADDKPVAIRTLTYFVMGQVCIAKDWRGQGLFEALYDKLFDLHGNDFDAVITEVASRNHRSISAHHRVGFQTFHHYEAALEQQERKEAWELMIWDWRAKT